MRGGADLRHELRRARDLGCTVEVRHGGDLLVKHPSQSRPITISGHRRDAPRTLTSYLNQLERGVQRAAVIRRKED